MLGTFVVAKLHRAGVEVVIEAEDVGANLPVAYIRQPDGSLFYPVDDSEYPAFARRFLAWIPWHGRGRLKAEIQRELDTRVRRLAALAEAHVTKLA